LEFCVREVKREFANVGGELGFVHAMLARPVEQHVKHRLIILADNSGEQINDLAAAQRRQMPDHSEDEGDAVARELKHVARVRVTVKEAVDEDHPEHGITTACRK